MFLSQNRRTCNPARSPEAEFVDIRGHVVECTPLVVENRILPPARENEVSTWYFTEPEVRFKGSAGTRVTYEERFARYEIHST